MKKMIVLFLTIALLLGTLAGCHLENDPTESSKPVGTEETDGPIILDKKDEPTEPVGAVELTKGELDMWAERLSVYDGENINPVACFFDHYWANVSELSLPAFISHFPGENIYIGNPPEEGQTLNPNEVEAFLSGTAWQLSELFIIRAVSADEVDRVLSKYVGVTRDKLNSGTVYLEESGHLYSVTDGLPKGFVPTEGHREGNTVTLMDGAMNVLTVRETDEGWKLVSYLPDEAAEKTITDRLTSYFTNFMNETLLYIDGDLTGFTVLDGRYDLQDRAYKLPGGPQIAAELQKNISFYQEKAKYFKGYGIMTETYREDLELDFGFENLIVSEETARAEVHVYATFRYTGLTEPTFMENEYTVDLINLSGEWLIADVDETWEPFDGLYKGTNFNAEAALEEARTIREAD